MLSFDGAMPEFSLSIGLTGDDSDEESEAEFDELGQYTFEELSPGTYLMSYSLVLPFDCYNYEMATSGDIGKQWLGVTGTNNAGATILIGISSEFTIAAGDVLQQDFELSC